MIGNFGEIFRAWYISFNPTEQQEDLAKYRASVCDGCEHKVEMDSAILKSLTASDQLLNKYKCGACGCILSKKIFSPYISCPKQKWEK